LALETLEPLLVLGILRGEALDRRLGKKQRERSPVLCWVDERRDNGKPIGLEREVDPTLAAAVFFRIGFPRRLTVAPVHDDLELILRAKRRSESRDKGSAPEPIAGDDAQACRLMCHQVLLTSSNAGA
jgi:hypothetical protein